MLVSAANAISYLDRQTLPVAIGAIREDIPISNHVKAILDSAFLSQHPRHGSRIPCFSIRWAGCFWR